jgi:hypothetical protein
MNFFHDLRVAYNVAYYKREVDDQLKLQKTPCFFIDERKLAYSVAASFKEMGYDTTCTPDNSHYYCDHQIEIKGYLPNQP